MYKVLQKILRNRKLFINFYFNKKNYFCVAKVKQPLRTNSSINQLTTGLHYIFLAPIIFFSFIMPSQFPEEGKFLSTLVRQYIWYLHFHYSLVGVLLFDLFSLHLQLNNWLIILANRTSLLEHWDLIIKLWKLKCSQLMHSVDVPV